MIQIAPQMRLLIAVEPADFRRGVDGLVRSCREALGADPFALPPPGSAPGMAPGGTRTLPTDLQRALPQGVQRNTNAGRAGARL
jgi:hypothetical protein